jgi:hypothetical protein
MRARISPTRFHKLTKETRQRSLSLKVTRGGRVHVTKSVPADWHSVWFEKNLVHQENEKYYFDDESCVVYMFVDAVLSVVFYLEDRKLLSVAFSARLREHQLLVAVREMRKAGLGRFVAPAARQALRHAPPETLDLLGKALKRLARRKG